MNKIRTKMAKEIEEFIPLLRETYDTIAKFQLNRTEDNEIRLRLKLIQVSRVLQKFKPLVQKRWQVYFEVLEEPQGFPISDLISALDCAIHQMHLRAGNKSLVREGANMDALTPWSKEMREFLNERRMAHLANRGSQLLSTKS